MIRRWPANGQTHISLQLIALLIEGGHAYVAKDGSGDVYFDVNSWPAYGELSGQRAGDMLPAPDGPERAKRRGGNRGISKVILVWGYFRKWSSHGDRDDPIWTAER